MKLGIDVGRVLISEADASVPDTSFIGGDLEDALRTAPFEGMFEVVPRLVAKFSGHVWIISKCGPRVQEKTRAWLRHHQFFERAGGYSAQSAVHSGARLGRNRSNPTVNRSRNVQRGANSRGTGQSSS